MSEPSAHEKLDALKNRRSDSDIVKGIEAGGHMASGAVVAEGALSAWGSGGMAALRCFAGRLLVPLGAAMAGAAIADAAGADDALVKVLGAPRQAACGPQPAHAGHKIAHNFRFGGLVTGLLVGVLVGVAVGLTSGLLAPILAGAAGGFVASMIGNAGKKIANICGYILDGSPDVFFEGERVARVTDPVVCDKHPGGPPLIIEGSKTIFINGLPLARIGHQISCTAVIQEGCRTIFADPTTAQYGEPDAEFSVWEQLFLSTVEVLSLRSASREGGLLNRGLRRLFGEPIDAATGDYASYHTDFEYPSILPLQLTRTYLGRERVAGLLGTKWICNWSQRLLYDPEEHAATLEDADGQRLKFALGNSEPFDAVHLKAPCYHLTGTRRRARLFDTRTQQTLVFETSEESPGIGVLTAVEDRNGNRIDFQYAERYLARIVHSDGVSFSVSTTPEGCIESITLEGENRELVRYAYDASGAMTDVHSRFAGELHYAYTEEGWLKHWRDSGATRADFDYDAQGRVVATRTPDGMYNDRFIYHSEERKTEYIDATGACHTIWFNVDNLPVREQDPLGNVVEHQWDTLEQKLSTTDALGRTSRFHYDAFGRLIAETDWAGRTTRYRYDKYGLITQVEHPDGRKSVLEYDDRGNLLSATGPDGVTFRWSYDDHGRVLAETSPDNTTSRRGYDRKGRLAAWRDPLGRRTTYERDIWGRLQSVTDAAGRTTRYRYEPGLDNPREDISRIVHPDGGEERFGYDKEGLLAVHTGAEGQITRYRHGAFDLLHGINDAVGYTTKLGYDKAARLTRVTNAAGHNWAYTYDAAGRLVMETDWAGRQTYYQRDAVGRVLSKHLPDGTEQHIGWDHRDRITSIAGASSRIIYEYDEHDRLVLAATYKAAAGKNAVQENEGEVNGESARPETEIRLIYDERGRLSQEIQNGIAVEYKYDASGRLISRTSPSGETRLAYGPLGLIESFTSNGHALSFERNALGLETLRQYHPADAPGRYGAFTLQQSYDPCGRLASQFAGRSHDNASPFLPSDPLHHLSSALELPGQVARRYKWDQSGRVVDVADNLRGKTRYSFDLRDQATGVEHHHQYNARLPSEHYRYDALMNIMESNGRAHYYHRDCVHRIGGKTYRYDARGRVTTKTITRNGFRPRTWLYCWDDFDRLMEAKTPEGERWRYRYDAFGRRVKKECLTPVKPGKVESITYLWQGATLAEEWQTHADGGGSSKPILAGAKGNRTQVNRWHFEPGTFIPIAKETLDLPAAAENGGDHSPNTLHESGFYPIVPDHLGTPKEIFDANGECLWQAEHTLWGKASVFFQGMQKQRDSLGRNTGAYSPLPEVDCSLRFQNQWEDEESGLYYNLNRYYDPDSGQYLSPDPIGLEGGLRTHGYVHDPMRWVDPWGLAGCTSKNALDYVPTKYRLAISRTFQGEPKAVTLSEDLVVYRHWGGKSAEVGSPWFSPKQYAKPGNARRYLALPEGNTSQNVTQFRIPAGTTVLEGKVAPQAGEVGFGSYATGGGTQIYLPDPSLAKPIR